MHALLVSKGELYFYYQLVASMSPSADVLALASAEFLVSGIAEGNSLTVKWRGKPVFIRHRTADEVAKEVAVPMSILPDPQPDVDRAKIPEWYGLVFSVELNFLSPFHHFCMYVGFICSVCALNL